MMAFVTRVSVFPSEQDPVALSQFVVCGCDETCAVLLSRDFFDEWSSSSSGCRMGKQESPRGQCPQPA